MKMVRKGDEERSGSARLAYLQCSGRREKEGKGSLFRGYPVYT
jgi:hypothetical protein